MKRYGWVILALGLGLTTPGCILTSGQVQILFDLLNFSASSSAGIDGATINLNDRKEYQDNKAKLQTLSDVAVLGKFKNNSATAAVNVEVWITPAPTAYTTTAQLTADATKIKMWGPFSVAAGATKQIDWDQSAALFSAAGKAALLAEAKGDGNFSIYAVAASGATTYDFTVTNGELVLVIDVGI